MFLQVDFEKSSVKKLEKDLKKASSALEEERAAAAKHKEVAVLLIKERKRLLQRLVELQQAPAPDGSSYSQNQIEAVLENQQCEFDVEREQLKARLAREELRAHELAVEVERLRQQYEGGVVRVTDHKVQPPRVASPHTGIPQPTGASKYRSTPPNTPPEMRRVTGLATQESPERDLGGVVKSGPHGDSSVKRAIMQFSHASPTRTPDRTIIGADGKPLSVEKPMLVPVDAVAPRMMTSTNATVFSSPTSGTTVFTTTSGTRISLNVGASNLPRKSNPLGRGIPPPVPPNKPQYMPQAAPRKELVRMVTPRPETPVSKPQPPTKFGITISKDKITISSPESPNDNTRQLAGHARPMAVSSTGTGSGEGTAVRKPSQVCLNIK